MLRRLVPARRQPSSRSPVPGAGARAAAGPRPRLSALLRRPDPGSRALPPGFYARALGVGCAAGRRVPPLRAPPPAGAARRLRAGAGWAQGAGHAAREGTTAQPMGADPPPPAFPLRLFPAPESQRARGRGEGPHPAGAGVPG